MVKEKGTGGGRQLDPIKTIEEYNRIRDYLINPLRVGPPANLSKRKQTRWEKRIKRNYAVLDNGIEGEWPNGCVLHVKLYANKKAQTPMQTLLYVPPWHKEEILHKMHGTGKECAHFGRGRLHKALKVKYYGISQEDCLNFLKSCEHCRVRVKLLSTYTYLLKAFAPIEKRAVTQPIIVEKPGDRITIDLVDLSAYKLDNDGYCFLLTMIDCLSQMVWGHPLPRKEAALVMEKLREWKQNYGPPKCIQSDNGGEFIANESAAEIIRWGTEIAHGAPYRPQTQGRIERWNQTIQVQIGKSLTELGTRRWTDILPDIIQ